MNLDEFVKKYDGKFIEVSGTSAMYQCIDLVNLFFREVQGMPIIEYADAKMIWDKAPSIYKRIEPKDYPKKGDIVIWSSGSYGHIAIATGIRNGDKFQTFSQNYPLKSKAHLQDYFVGNYKLKGYLRLEAEVDEREVAKKVFCHTLNGYFNSIYGRSFEKPEEQFSKDFDFWYGKYGVECAGHWVDQQVNEAEFKDKWVKKADVVTPTDYATLKEKLAKIKDIVA